jgi:uncharacterized membrane protein YkvA (DUF1232 family)
VNSIRESYSNDPICGLSSLGNPGRTESPRPLSSGSSSKEIVAKIGRRLRQLLEDKTHAWTNEFIVRLRRVKERGGYLHKAPDRLRTAAARLEVCIDLIQDLRTGRYTDVSWPAALVISGAILYVVSPADVIPDFLPGLGSLDDTIVLAVATNLAEPELRKYCERRGYNVSTYFPPNA